MDKKDAYEQKLQAQLDEWSAEIDKLKARAKRAEADARLELDNEIESLEKQQRRAQEKLEELRSAGEDAWDDLKAGLDSAWENLKVSVRSASSRFK